MYVDHNVICINIYTGRFRWNALKILNEAIPSLFSVWDRKLRLT